MTGSPADARQRVRSGTDFPVAVRRVPARDRANAAEAGAPSQAARRLAMKNATDNAKQWHFRPNNVTVIETATGAIRWRTATTADRPEAKDKKGRPIREGHLCSLVPMRLGDTDVVVDSYGIVIRVRDGKFLHRIADPFADAEKDGGKRSLSGIATGAAVGDVFLCPVSGSGGGTRGDVGVRAFRLKLDGDAITSEGLWDQRGATCGSIVAHQGKVYAHVKFGHNDERLTEIGRASCRERV